MSQLIVAGGSPPNTTDAATFSSIAGSFGDLSVPEFMERIKAAVKEAVQQNGNFGRAVADASHNYVGKGGSLINIATSIPQIHFHINEGNVSSISFKDERDIVSMPGALRTFGGKLIEVLEQKIAEANPEVKGGVATDLYHGHFHIHGLAGLGKTELALKFVHKHFNLFSLKWFINCKDENSYREGYKGLANALGVYYSAEDSIEVIRNRVHNKLQNPPFSKAWIIIFDDVQSTIPLPPTRNGIIFTTSQQEKLWRQAEEILVPVRSFDREETEELFRDFSNERIDDLDGLMREFKGWPVLLVQAYNYLTEIPECKLSDYLKVVQQIEPLEDHTDEDRYPQSLWKAFEATLQHIEAKSPEAAPLAYLCAFFSTEGIPLSFLERKDNPRWRRNVLGVLENFSILRFNEKEMSFNLHGLWQEFLKKKLRNDKKGFEFFSQAVDKVYQESQGFDISQVSTWPKGRICALHTDVMRNNIDWVSIDPGKQYFLLDCVGDWLLHVGGNARLALSYYQESLEIKQKILGITHRETLASLANVGLGLLRMGQTSSAFETLSQAVRLGEVNPQNNGRELAKIYDNLGQCLLSSGKLEEAGVYFQNALKIRQGLYGDNHSETIRSYINVVIPYLARSRLESEEMKSKVMDHSFFGMNVEFEDMGVVLRKYTQDTLTLNRTILGEDHIWTARSYESHATYSDKPEEALTEMQNAVRIKESKLEKNDPELAETYEKFSMILSSQKRYQEAIDYRKKANDIKTAKEKYSLRMSKRFPGGVDRKEDPKDPMGAVLSLPILDPGGAALMGEMGLFHPYILKKMIKLRECSQYAGTYLQKALELSQKNLGEKHPTTGILYKNMGSLLVQMGVQQGLEYLRKGLRIVQEQLGENHPETMKCYISIYVSCHELSENNEEGIQAMRNALAISQKIFGEDHADSIRLLSMLGEALARSGKTKEDKEEAVILLKKAVQMIKQSPSGEDKTLIACQMALGTSLQLSKQYEEAYASYKEAFELTVKSQDKKRVGLILERLLDCLRDLPTKSNEMKVEILPEAVKILGRGSETVKHVDKILSNSQMKKNHDEYSNDDDDSEEEYVLENKRIPRIQEDATFSSSAAPNAGPIADTFTSEDIALYLWLAPAALISNDMVQKVNTVSVYLKERGFELAGVQADGNCYCHAFMKSYQKQTQKIPILDSQEDPISYLRKMIASQYRASHRTGDRAKKIEQDGEWLTSEEGDLLAKALSIPIRTITVNEAQGNCDVSDMLTFPERNRESQLWSSLSEEERPKNFLLIVDLGGHFVYAEPLKEPMRKFPDSTTAVLSNLSYPATGYLLQGSSSKGEFN